MKITKRISALLLGLLLAMSLAACGADDTPKKGVFRRRHRWQHLYQ